MDTHYSPGGSNSLDDDHLNEDMGDDATNIPGSSVSTSSKKKGPSIGIEEIEGQPRPKLVMQTNQKSQLVTAIDVVSEFGTRLGYIAHRDFVVCYEDWRHIGKDLKDKVVKTLGCQFVFEYEKTIDIDYTRQKLNEAWRNYKHTLYETFVKDEDPSLVKEVAPCNIPLEEWHKFVDYCNTNNFKAMSARNKLNREQQIMHSSLGRTLVAIARNELALEKDIPESEITRADSYMLIYKPKETVPQSQEVLNHISEHPESQYDLSGDAIATVVGPDKRGHFRGLGTGVCKTVLEKGDSLMKKNDGLMEANTLLERRMETMEANMDAKMSRHMEEVRGLFMSQRGTFNDNVPSPHSHASHHSTALSLGVGLFKLLEAIDALKSLLERKLEDGEDEEALQILKRLISAREFVDELAKLQWLSISFNHDFEMCCVEDVVCWNAMIDGYVKYSEMELAKLVFERIVCRDVVSWNTMINGYALVGSIKEAKRLFDEMPERNLVYWNSMLAGYVKCDDVEGAHGIFYKMPRRDVVSWNAMLACYAQSGKSNEAMELFNEMRDLGVKPTEATVVSLSSAFGHLGALDQGASLHAYISEHKIGLTTIVELKDVLTWNTIITGMAMHGHAAEALRLFKEMQEAGVCPNDITFVAVLSACSHAGMVDEDRRFLACMSNLYGIDPKVEHYGCVIDLLSRAGLLVEAVELIERMSMEPNSSAWGALLGGCRIHGNIEVGELVGKHLVNIQPHHSAILANSSDADNVGSDDIVSFEGIEFREKISESDQSCELIQTAAHVDTFVKEEI
ncbi:hypothetical protein IFM89_037891 [Coptis chinensis]|uniref:Pentatricopeptide repeat-containing protein n=1 Tax=Coptis chinensis TaxID=261450 RepID=A0A835LTK6_9MAGN|nr:hypothetical protein IFM89_037891 [Coptis chinensis]